MKKWFAECLDTKDGIMTLTTRAFTKEQAIENLVSTYRLNAILTIDDKPLFRSPMVSYMSSSLAGML